MVGISKVTEFARVLMSAVQVGGVVIFAGIVCAQNATIQVPSIGCEGGGQVAMVKPKDSMVSVSIDPANAPKLAYYVASNGLGVLAPRGWSCYGTVGSGGDGLVVTRTPSDRAEYFSDTPSTFEGPFVSIVHRIGETSGRFSIADVVMRVFPEHKEFAEDVKSMFDWVTYTIGPYPGDKLNYKGNSIVEYTTPAHTDGLGTYWGLKKSDRPVTGVAIYIEQKTPDLLLLAARLPPEFDGIIPIVVRQVERNSEEHIERLRLRSLVP